MVDSSSVQGVGNLVSLGPFALTLHHDRFGRDAPVPAEMMRARPWTSIESALNTRQMICWRCNELQKNILPDVHRECTGIGQRQTL